ncbi:jg9040 [Pararge aegeria aegeria]|uniref:Jg9040 protein n=1 Tax=Pararge aegeria aegeria TaxID=348720 RepID=A0A8S4RFL4_9NEOP|nr:jg9040 [Pararge aegeria aegeria]
MLGVSLRHQIRNEEIRRRTRVTNIAQRVAKLKWKWVGHIARRTDGRWGSKVLEWRSRTDKHPDTEKHSCSSHKHSPVVGIDPTAWDSESRVAAHCATRPSMCVLSNLNITCFNGERKHREETCMPESSSKCSERCVKLSNPYWASVVD